MTRNAVRARAAKSTRGGAPASAPAAEDDSLVKQAYARLEERIVTLQLAPGQLVSENMLADMLEMGRTPIREALQQLAREGLVVILPKRGIVIAPMDVRKQLRLLEVRRSVERVVAAMAARRATDAERERFAALAKEMARAGKADDGTAFLKLDGEFNQLMMAAARNEYATAALKLMQGLSQRYWFAHYRTAADVPETARLHAAIAQAIAQRDEEGAAKALDQLLDNVEAFTRATLDAVEHV
jgi:DNA-binding GntR family transcriptional regulator